MSTRTGRGANTRRLTTVAAVALSIVGLAACGSHHHKTAAPTTTASTVPPTTTTVAPKPYTGAYAPLTDLREAAAATHQPAVVVKIDNIQQALPQTGVNQADVVYEELVEGGLTRLAAIFQSQYPTTVGPVRSGRLTDEGIADDLNHPVFAYAGANTIFQPILEAQPFEDVDDDNHPALFVRNDSREAPHNLYSNVGELAATDSPSGPPAALFEFRGSGTKLRGDGVAPASTISISWPATSVEWTWSPAQHLWLRTQNGAADVDSTGTRLSANNIIVQFIPYITSAYATGEGLPAPAPIPEGEMVGSGGAWLLSDGAIVKGTWSRSSLTSVTTFTDEAGKAFKLQPGRTWVELAVAGTVPTVTP